MENELDDEGEEVVEYPSLAREVAAENISQKVSPGSLNLPKYGFVFDTF
jgi:hypothetical protein